MDLYIYEELKLDLVKKESVDIVVLLGLGSVGRVFSNGLI